jgi:hypothetical protein
VRLVAYVQFGFLSSTSSAGPFGDVVVEQALHLLLDAFAKETPASSKRCDAHTRGHLKKGKFMYAKASGSPSTVARLDAMEACPN